MTDQSYGDGKLNCRSTSSTARSALFERFFDALAYNILLSLDQSSFLVLGFALLTPLGRNVNSIVFLLIALFLRLVHARRLVLRRAVHSVQNEGCRPSVDELMLRACRHDDEIAAFDVLVFAGDGGFTLAGSEGKDLVDCVFLLRKNVREARGEEGLNDGRTGRVECRFSNIPRRQCPHQQELSLKLVGSKDPSITPVEIHPTLTEVRWSCWESKPSHAWVGRTMA